MKPYHQIEIIESGEPLLPIPLEYFVVENPPPYQKLGADYQGRSPYYLRQGVMEILLKARANLSQLHPGWKLKIFDAYRPVEVQQFMVDYSFNLVCQQRGLNINQLSAKDRQNIYEQVYQIWAIPSNNPQTPPPHSTGAAVDITLVDEGGNIVDMGGEIDELSGCSHPNYYAAQDSLEARKYHNLRQLLNEVLTSAGFRRHPGEWWHFSWGDQMWAWLYNQEYPQSKVTAKYGLARIGK
jgi:D-alanyl-D-alanine dipeptidase